MRKVFILTLQGSYLAYVDKGLEDWQVNFQIKATLGSRDFRWYYLDQMLELPLKPIPKELKDFKSL